MAVCNNSNEDASLLKARRPRCCIYVSPMLFFHFAPILTMLVCTPCLGCAGKRKSQHAQVAILFSRVGIAVNRIVLICQCCRPSTTSRSSPLCSSVCATASQLDRLLYWWQCRRRLEPRQHLRQFWPFQLGC